MTLVVSGRIAHHPMQPDQVGDALRRHLPGLLKAVPDFSVERVNCTVEFFCNTNSTLDFKIALKNNVRSAPAAVATLVRETESLNEVLTRALGRRASRAKVKYCLLEDFQSHSGLMNWIWEKPLSSRPAKLSYVLCLGLLILAAFLVHGMFEEPASSSRNYNIISLILAICLPALTLPLPFLFEYLKARGKGRWLFSQIGGESS
jgi:hypothetical protein